MRLIHTTSLKLCEFLDSDIPDYAILSHCWGKDEVSFQEYTTGSEKDGSGYAKILNCCNLAREKGLDWAWVDSCCIDKSSSAELSEALNSMFRWYRFMRIPTVTRVLTVLKNTRYERAVVCFAFLHDYDLGSTASKLSKCRWFRRGFTLQELLAPREVLFFDCSVRSMGTRTFLAPEISKFTKISLTYLLNHGIVHEASVAQRMSWASRRHTSRAEDIAYCLLGIFDVSMPLLYGEGREKAFLRLQHQIVAQSSDESIFAWKSNTRHERSGMLAKLPSEFRYGENIRPCSLVAKRPLYTLTSKGLEFPVPTPLVPDWLVQAMPTYFRYLSVQLECVHENTSPSEIKWPVYIRLERDAERPSLWYRASSSELQSVSYNYLKFWRQDLLEVMYGWTQLCITEPQASKHIQSTIYGEHAFQYAGSNVPYLLGSMLWILSLSPNLMSLEVLPEDGACGHSKMILLWVYLAWCWKLSHYSYWYLAFVIGARWLLGNLDAPETLFLVLVRIAFVAAMRILGFIAVSRGISPTGQTRTPRSS